MQKIIDRFQEPSSYAALAAVLALIGVQVPDELWGYAVQALSGLFGVIGFFMREKSDA